MWRTEGGLGLGQLLFSCLLVSSVLGLGFSVFGGVVFVIALWVDCCLVDYWFAGFLVVVVCVNCWFWTGLN